MIASERFSFDTNILIYAADRTAGARHEQAAQLVTRGAVLEAVLILQTLGEFYHAGTRKGIVQHERARWMIGRWRSVLPVACAGPETLDAALELRARRSISFWDAMLVSTAASAGCTVLLSEDMQDGEIVLGVRIADPFKHSLEDLGLAR